MKTLSDVASKEQLIANFNAVLADTEALLNATSSHGGEKMAEVRAKTEESIKAVKSRMAEAQTALRVRTKAAARATDAYVHENPWKVAGISTGVAVAIGVAIGLLIDRR